MTSSIWKLQELSERCRSRHYLKYQRNLSNFLTCAPDQSSTNAYACKLVRKIPLQIPNFFRTIKLQADNLKLESMTEKIFESEFPSQILATENRALKTDISVEAKTF